MSRECIGGFRPERKAEENGEEVDISVHVG
jgi:hypothetical protein